LSAAAIREPDPALLEPSAGQPDLMLPRIAAGQSPEHAYAAAFSPAERHPRIALVIDGIGLNGALSARANQTLPAAIDFAFSAYAPEVSARALAAAARGRGRECLVSVPMEPAGYPLAEEGSGALLTGADQDQNHRRLLAALAHVPGCVGATAASDGMAGERYAAMHEAYGDALEEIANRGLLYLDPRPSALPLPGPHPPRDVDVVIDEASNPSSPATAEMIDEHLAALERLAGEHGSAIGLAGPPRPLLVERLAVWANGLAARGLVLAPLTAIRPPDPPLASQ